MNNLYFSIIALLVSAIITLVYGCLSDNTACIVISLIIFLIMLFRVIVSKKYASFEVDYKTIQDDMIAKKLKTNDGRYAMMYNLYKSNHCELLYGENDGILLYDNKNDLYMVSTSSVAACKDIVSKMKYSTNELLIFDTEYVNEFINEYRNYEEIIYYVNYENNRYTIKNSEYQTDDIDIKSANYEVTKGIYFDALAKQKKYMFAKKNNELIDDKVYSYTFDTEIGNNLGLTKNNIFRFYK